MFSQLFTDHAVAAVRSMFKGKKMTGVEAYAAFEAELEVIGHNGGLPYPSDGEDLDEGECRDRCRLLGLGELLR